MSAKLGELLRSQYSLSAVNWTKQHLKFWQLNEINLLVAWNFTTFLLCWLIRMLFIEKLYNKNTRVERNNWEKLLMLIVVLLLLCVEWIVLTSPCHVKRIFAGKPGSLLSVRSSQMAAENRIQMTARRAETLNKDSKLFITRKEAGKGTFIRRKKLLPYGRIGSSW